MGLDLNSLSKEVVDKEVERLIQEILFNPHDFDNYLDIILLSIQQKDFSKSSSYFYGLFNNAPSLSTIRRILKKPGHKEYFQSLDFPIDFAENALIKSYFLYFYGFSDESKNIINGFVKEDFLYNGFYFDLIQYLLFDEIDYENDVKRINFLLQEGKSKGIVINLAGLFYWDYNDFNKSVYYFSLAIKNYSFCPDYFYNRGRVFYENKKYKVAIRDLKMCLKLNKSNSGVYALIGLAMFKSKHFLFDDCVSVIEKGIQINSNNEFCFKSLIEIHKSNGDYPMKCLDFATNLIRISPDNDQHYFERSKWWLYPIHLKNAILDLEKAISINSQDYEYFKMYSSCLFEYKDYKGAINALQKCLEIKPAFSFINLEIAKNYFYLLDFENTVVFMKKEEVSDWDLEDFYMYGYSLNKIGRFEESVYYYSKGIENLDTAYLELVLTRLFFSGRGFSYKMLGEKNKSVNDFHVSRIAWDGYYDCNLQEQLEKMFPQELRCFS